MNDEIILTHKDKEWLKATFCSVWKSEMLPDANVENVRKQADECIAFFSYINSLPEKDIV